MTDPESGVSERRAALALACLYVAIMSGHFYSIDGLLIYRQALSLVYEGSLHFGAPLQWSGSSHVTSKYGLGLSLLYVPGVLLGSAFRSWAPLSGWAMFYRDPLYPIACALIHVLVVACSAYLVGRLVRTLGFDRRTALWGMAFFGVGSPAIVYARGDWAQPLAGLWLIAGIYAVARFPFAPRPGDAWWAGAAVLCAVLTRPVEGLLLFLAILAIEIPHLDPRRCSPPYRRAIAVTTVSFVAGAGVTLAVNWARYGSPFVTGYEGSGWTTSPWVGLAGALVSPGRGLLLAAPAILLLPLGLRRLWPSDHRRVAIVLAATVAAELISTATWNPWWGGWNWGLRLFVPALPLVAVLAAVGVTALGPSLRVWAPATLLFVGIVWALPCLAVDLLHGYGGRYDSSSASFAWSAYPPIWAWLYFAHLHATGLLGLGIVDNAWLRSVRATHYASLLPLFGSLAAAVALIRNSGAVAERAAPRRKRRRR